MFKEAPQFTFPVSLVNTELLEEIIRFAFANSVSASVKKLFAASLSYSASLKVAEAIADAASLIFAKKVLVS